MVAAPALGRGAASTRATRSSPTARAAARRSPRTRSRSATRTSRTPPYTCASRCSARTARRRASRCWSGRRRPGRCPATSPSPSPPASPTSGRGRGRDPDPRRAAGREGPRRGRRDRRAPRRARTSSAAATRSRLRPRRPRAGRLPDPRRRLRHHRGRHRPRPHRARLRRGRLRGRRRERDLRPDRPRQPLQPGRLDGTFDERVAGLRGPLRQGPRGHRGLIADLERRGLLFREQVYEHAYPHCWRCGTPLLYYAKSSWYVAHLRGPRPDARQQRDDRLAPRAHQARPLRQMAREQRRLGALPRPLLGHAAADLGVRRDGLRRDASAPARSPSCASAPAARSPRTCTALT